MRSLTVLLPERDDAVRDPQHEQRAAHHRNRPVLLVLLVRQRPDMRHLTHSSTSSRTSIVGSTENSLRTAVHPSDLLESLLFLALLFLAEIGGVFTPRSVEF